MAKPKSIATRKFQRMYFMEQELAYSFHLGSDKNKSKLAKKVAKENVSGTTSLANNAIQNAKDLSDVKQVYLEDFEQARIEYNNNQTRNDRKIELGDMDFWNDKYERYKFKMVDVYNEQVIELIKIVPDFKF